jgi:hypothetical protein
VHEVVRHSDWNAGWDGVVFVLEGYVGGDTGEAVHYAVGETVWTLVFYPNEVREVCVPE